MIQIVWEFIVKPDAVHRFQSSYGPAGDWARLFERYPGFRGTTLLHDTANPRRFLTIDRWETLDDFSRMRSGSSSAYADLDRAFADLTESEHELGVFVPTMA